MIDYLESEKYLTKDNTFSYEILNSDEYRGWSMRYKDGKILYNLCKELKPEIVLEIGTFHGYSAAYMLSALEDNKKGFLYTIEEVKSHIDIANINLNKISNGYKILHGAASLSLQSYRPLIKEVWTKPIGFLFIDGDHSFKSVASDLKKYEPFVIKSGIIACHDYMMPEVQPAVDGYFESRMDQYYIKILNDKQFHNHLYIAYKKDN